MDDIRLNNEHKMRPEDVRNCPKCLVPLGTTSKPYEVNSAVDVKLLDKWAAILPKKTNW